MPRKLCYADAVKLLGGTDSAIVATLDRLTGGLLLALTGGGSQFAVSLFDAKGELARLSGQLVTGLAGRMRGLSRYDRTERLTAAHKVIVLTAFFEAVTELSVNRRELIELATGAEPASNRLRDLADILNDSDVPGGPHEHVENYYESLSGRLGSLLNGSIAESAVRRYEEHLRRLAADFPEVAFWSDRLGHETTHRGLEGLGRVLEQIASGAAPDEPRQALARRYHKILQRPVVEAGEVPEGLALPSLAEAYVNPSYRVTLSGRSDRLDQENWWEPLPVHDDLQDFLVAHLTSVRATECPLIVLGQPGSGKSVLTKVLAARLPATDFMAVRVVLREVPADTDLQSQIEYAIRDATGESLSWPALARAAGDALPVIMLDGFDELLQATGIGQTDYLEQIVRFQEREADQGRPAAVIVTSRTAVADRVRIPPGGAVAVRLEPFNEAQVERWLLAWNAVNASPLAARGLRPLPTSAALRQPALAEQPLLLLMLALYDATDNALQQLGDELNEADLYERILTRFAEREINKTHPEFAHAELRAAIDEELLRLSVAAFAMFNRGRQWATEEELTADLGALLGITATAPAEFRSPLTPAQIIVGRFFFVHEAKAIRDGVRLTTCEFLHATFGEFLIARLIAYELADLAAVTSVTTTRARQAADDGFLRALLSFAPLTMRGKIVEFLVALARDRSPTLRDALLAAFHTALDVRRDWGPENYEPVRLSAPTRCAALSANLLLLTVLVGGPLYGQELFPRATYPVAEWRRHAMLWRSQFYGEGWISLAASIRLERIRNDDDREIAIELGTPEWDPPALDALWAHNYPTAPTMQPYIGWRQMDTRALRRESYFTCDKAEDVAWHALEPLTLDHRIELGSTKTEGVSHFGTNSGRALSTAHALIRLWTVSGDHVDTNELEQAYRDCLAVIPRSHAPSDTETVNHHLTRLLRQLAADASRLSRDLRAQARDIFKDSGLEGPSEWWEQAFGDL